MPTMQAVELAKEAGVTLVCGARKDQMRIYTDNRIKR
jgi:formate dehydrogenase assembly factor FdhD